MVLALTTALASAQTNQLSVVLPQSQAKAFIGQHVGPMQIVINGTWDPSLSDINSLESNLHQIDDLSRTLSPPRRVQHADGYYRQYLGLLQGDRKLIYVNAFCGINNDQPPNHWRDRLVMIWDGGSCVWQAMYDLSAKKFVSLSVNGVA
jgi:hypothetical protein